MVRLPVVLAALTLALVLTLPQDAEAKLVVRKGITGAHLGMTKARVKQNLGRPKHVKRGSSDFGRFVEYRYGRLRIVFSDGGRRATLIATTRKRERTGKGVGVGSSSEDVEQRVPGATCSSLGTIGACDVGNPDEPATRVTTFLA